MNRPDLQAKTMSVGAYRTPLCLFLHIFQYIVSARRNTFHFGSQLLGNLPMCSPQLLSPIEINVSHLPLEEEIQLAPDTDFHFVSTYLGTTTEGSQLLSKYRDIIWIPWKNEIISAVIF